VNGQQAVVQYVGGYPGSTNAYQVNFVMPQGVAAGAATLQLSAAWVGGSSVTIMAR
jgi:uncharacterized protein (TIGR03437 family)